MAVNALRVLGREHWPSDVIAGDAVGIAGIAAAHVVTCTAHHFGPEIGGLFPAILPASLTLVTQHDGRRQAADDARGAMVGSIGLAAFALVTWRTGAHLPGVVVLAVATIMWTVVSVAMWAMRYGRRSSVAERRRGYRVA